MTSKIQDRKKAHRQYFARFVTPETKQAVIDEIGLERLLKTSDRDREHLNNISLAEWDAIVVFNAKQISLYNAKPHFNTVGCKTIKHINGLKCGEQVSLSTLICTLKEAAKQIIESNRKVLFQKPKR